MKRALSIVLAAFMVTAMCFTVGAEDAKKWTAGNGFNLVGADKVVTTPNSPVTVKDNEDGSTTVSHGGYYTDGIAWGGVASADMYKVDGLKISVKFDKVPDATKLTDCWIYIGVLEKPELFQVGKVAENRGFMDLIRFANGKWEIYEGVEKFNNIENTEPDDMFKVKTGDVVTMSFKKNSSGLYNVTYDNNGKNFTLVTEFDFDKIFKDGMAYAVVSASQIGSEKDTFQYTIMPVNNDAVAPADPLEKYKTNDPEPGAIKVYVDDARVAFDQPPVIIEERTLVPVRAIVEALGAEVGWDDATKTVSAKLGENTVELKIGSTQIKLNGAVVGALDVPAQIINERTLIPVRAISEAFGCDVQWVGETQTVVITKK